MTGYIIVGTGAALTAVPRLFEYIDSTNMIITTLLEQMTTANNIEDRKLAWETAVNEIKLHPYRHTIYLGCKFVGDGILIFTFLPRIFAWLKETYDYVRYLYNTSKEYLVAQYPTIEARVLKIFESTKQLENSSEIGMLKAAFERWANEFVQKLSTITGPLDAKSIWNVIKMLLRFLFDNFRFVAAKVFFNLPEIWSIVKMEVLKYIVQVIGCTFYYFEKINETCSFCSKTLKLSIEQTSDLLPITF
jgi:hypothetical protein